MDYFDQLTSGGGHQRSSEQVLSNVNSALGSQSANLRNQFVGLANQKKQEEQQGDAARQQNWSKVFSGAQHVGGQIGAMAPDPTVKAVGFALQTVGVIGSAIQGISQMGD